MGCQSLGGGGGRGRGRGLWAGLITTSIRVFISLWQLLSTSITEIRFTQVCSKAGAAIILQKSVVDIRVDNACYELAEVDLILWWDLEILIGFLWGFRIHRMLQTCH